MSNHYANAINVIARDMGRTEMWRVCIDYAKRHPKKFVEAAAKAGNYTAAKTLREQEPKDEG